MVVLIRLTKKRKRRLIHIIEKKKLGENFGWYVSIETQDSGVVQLLVFGKFASFGSYISNSSITFSIQFHFYLFIVFDK